MAADKASFSKVTGYFVGHIVGITGLFCIIAGVAVALDWFVKMLEPMSVRIPYFILILGLVEATVFYVDVVLFIVGVLAAAVLYIGELKKCF